jgi:hypothetical protein
MRRVAGSRGHPCRKNQTDRRLSGGRQPSVCPTVLADFAATPPRKAAFTPYVAAFVGRIQSCPPQKLQDASGIANLVFVAALRNLGAANDFAVDATEDAGQFTTANLGRYKAVVFLSTTGDVLNGEQQAAFMTYIRRGGGFVGIHAAVDTGPPLDENVAGPLEPLR